MLHLPLKLTHINDVPLFLPSYAHPQGTTAPSGPVLLHYQDFTNTLTHTTLGGTPLHERSARRRNLYLTTHNTHKRQTSLSPWDWNPQSRWASGRKTTPQAARPLGSSVMHMTKNMSTFGFHGNDMKNSRQKLPYLD